LYGERDKYKYNCRFCTELDVDATIGMLQGAHHQLKEKGNKYIRINTESSKFKMLAPPANRNNQ
jgi:hypothetical protein